jgi:transposase-like protein
MEDYPRNQLELERRFSTEKICRDYLSALRWPDGFICPICVESESWRLKDGLHLCSICNKKTSVTAGTIFERTRKPLVLWFRVAWGLTSQKYGANALGLQRAINIGTYKTAWTWLHKFRRAMVRPGRDRINGRIQVDETYIGGVKKGKRGRGAEGKKLVLIAAQEDGDRTGRIRLKRLDDASGASLVPAIIEMVEPGSLILTDGWTGYRRLIENGYRHEIIRRSVSVGDNLLPLCHRQASLVKRWLSGTYQGAVSHEQLDYYLDEYTFRFNRRMSKHRGKLFYRLLQNAVNIGPTTYGQIIKKGARGPERGHHNT